VPEAAVVYGDYERIDTAGRRIGNRGALRARRKPTGDVLSAILAGNFLVVGAQIVRHDAYRRAGGFDEKLGYCEDWHFWCRVAALAPFAHVPGCQVLDYRIHGASMMHATPRPFKDLAPAIEAVFGAPAAAVSVCGWEAPVRIGRRSVLDQSGIGCLRWRMGSGAEIVEATG
jgi:hypothetical protein